MVDKANAMENMVERAYPTEMTNLDNRSSEDWRMLPQGGGAVDKQQSLVYATRTGNSTEIALA